jgi:hypothetical protein
MRVYFLCIVYFLSTVAAMAADPRYPALSAYMMGRDLEVGLARSAAPAKIADHASIKILTEAGYRTAVEGDNGFTCIVMRGWAAPTYTPVANPDFVYDPTVRAPICFNPVAVRTVLPYQELRAALAMEGKGPEGMAQGVQEAYATAKIPKMEAVAFAYMLSADMYLGPQVRHYHPHVMVYAPYYDNKMLGDNPRGTLQMRTSDDDGTPFAVVEVPVDQSLAMQSKSTGVKS